MTFEKKQQGEEYWKKMAKNIEERNEVESTFGTNTTISSELNSLIQMKREQVHVIFQRM
jgi:coenzyme F420-reducing hydrogenase beta subunit